MYECVSKKQTFSAVSVSFFPPKMNNEKNCHYDGNHNSKYYTSSEIKKETKNMKGRLVEALII